MERELGRLEKLINIDFEKQKTKLNPFVELAKFITSSPVCEINIIDAYNQWTVARTEDSLKVIDREESVCHDTIELNSAYEIPDLSSHKRYQDRFYVTGAPHFRYYCGVQLTTSDGFNIGSICVLDTKSKQITARQKRQLEHLADLVIDYIERESRYFMLSRKLEELKDSLRKLNHDVRSPINGIMGIADILINDETNPDLPEEDLTMIKDAAQAIIDKIDGVLTTMDSSDNKERFLAKTTLSNVLKKIERLYNPLAQQKKHSLVLKNHINTEHKIPHYFSNTLTQIIGNLVANAIKFTPEEGTIEVILSGKTEEDKNHLNIVVKDNGKGMTTEQITAFNKGKRITQSKGTADEKSFGIGLEHICQLIAKQNGTIEAQENEEQGTKFLLSLPISVDD